VTYTGAGPRASDIVLRALVAAALAVDAFVHLTLAANYQLAAPGGIGAGNVFRIEAVVAILAALYVLIRGSRLSFAAAFVVAFSALVAVILYRYVDVPPIGPIPAMYEPIWFFQKTMSAVSEAIGALLAGVGFAMQRRGRATKRGGTDV
jgi:hypothetical protein